MVKTMDDIRPPHETVSMTGFAARRGSGLGHDWSWDIRAVNGKGFDLRLRLPEIEGLEPALRKAVAGRVARGNVSVSLRLSRSAEAETLHLDPHLLDAAITAIETAQEAARKRGLDLAPVTASDLVTMRGVIEHGAPPVEDPAPLREALLADFTALLEAFCEMRRVEGQGLGAVIAAQIDRIAALVAEAESAAEARRPETARTVREALARVMEGAAEIDEARLLQELAVIAMRNDVTEEIDRLRVHVSAARTLLVEPGAVGRKFEFLAQEFVREANTLCSKSNDAALTQIGLALKHVIDQMREQIQNVE